MEMTIYYSDLDEMSLEYLNSDKFRDRMKAKNLEPKLHSAKTPVITSTQFRKDNYAKLYLISEDLKDKWISSNKKKFMSKETTAVVSSFDDLEGILQQAFSLEYDPEKSAINYVKSEKGLEQLQENLSKTQPSNAPTPPSRKVQTPPVTPVTPEPEEKVEVEQEEPNHVVEVERPYDRYGQSYEQEPEEVDALTESLEDLNQGSLVEHQLNMVKPEPEEEKPKPVQEKAKTKPTLTDTELDILRGTENLRNTDWMSLESSWRKTDSFREDQAELTIVDGTELNASKVVHVFDVSGYDVTKTKEAEELEKYKKRIRELTKKIQEMYKEKLTYQSPEAVKELTDNYINLERDYGDLEDKYTHLLENGDPTTAKKIEGLRQEIEDKEEEVHRYKSDAEGLFKENSKLITEKQNLSGELRKLQEEFDLYKKEQERRIKDIQSREGNNLLEQNISLSDTNLRLRAENNRLLEQLNSTKRNALETKTGITDSIGVLRLPRERRYNNIRIVVSLDEATNTTFYRDLLTNPSLTKNTTLLVDLCRETELLDYFKMQKISSPNRFLQGKKSLKNSLHMATCLKQQNLVLGTLTASQHGVKRDNFKNADWEKVLEEVNHNPSIMYLGSLSDGMILDFIKTIQDNEIIVDVEVILPKELTRKEVFNLEDLDMKKLNLIGKMGSHYPDKMKIKYRY